MEFAQSVRAELARDFPKRRCCQRAELAAFVRFLDGAGREQVDLGTAHAAVARKLFLLGKQVPDGSVEMTESRAGRHRFIVRLTLPGPLPDAVPSRDCCGRAYLRGAWLSRGSISEPEAGYHLEFALPSEEDGERIQGLLHRYDIGAGCTRRKGGCVVYVKDADGIAEFLRVAGAHGALLTWEDYRVLKHMRNRVNRLVNAEAANMAKVADAAVQQLEAIRFIDARYGLERLPPSLKEAARLRLAHPDLSLADLGKQMSPPLSKSAVNHRMRRLAQFAEELRRKSSAPS